MRLTFLSFLLGIGLVGPTAVPQSPELNSTAAQSTYLTKPFDPSISDLTPNFKGHDISALLRVVEYTPTLNEKGEFETSTAYAARIASFADHALYGSLRVKSVIAFVVPISTRRGYGASFTYDPDTEHLQTELDLGSEEETSLPSIILKHSSRIVGSYIASNAFNAHARVTKYHDENLGIAFPNRPRGSIDNTKPISMPPLEARKHKPGLRLLLVCKLTTPWSNYEQTSSEATISEPEESTIETHSLYVEPISIWLFDQNTGEVLVKFDADPEECQSANKPSNEPYANCVKRVKERNADCAAFSGDAHDACIKRIYAKP